MDDERRRFRRHPISSLGRLFYQEDNRGTDVFLENISRGGIGMIGREPPDSGSMVRVQFPFFDALGEVHVATLDGRIAWSSSGAELARMGLKFVNNISSETHGRLSGMLDRLEGTA